MIGKTAVRHTSEEFVAFLDQIVTTQSRHREIHINADNLSAHKTAKVLAFLEPRESCLLAQLRQVPRRDHGDEHAIPVDAHRPRRQRDEGSHQEPRPCYQTRESAT